MKKYVILLVLFVVLSISSYARGAGYISGPHVSGYGNLSHPGAANYFLYTDGAATYNWLLGTNLTAFAAFTPTANRVLGYAYGSTTLSLLSSFQLDDTQAQFYSATASKGDWKMLMTSMSNGIHGIFIPVCTGDCVFTNATVGAGTYYSPLASATLPTATGATGTGKIVYDTSPTLVTPVLGTPTSGTMTNVTGLPKLSSAAYSATTSTELAGVLSDETGTGAAVFGTTPAITANQVDGSATADWTLVPANTSRTIINNYGMADSAQTLTLPTAAEGMTFIAIIGTQRNKLWKLLASGTDHIYWDAAGTLTAGKHWFGSTNDPVGCRASCATFQTGAAQYDWVCGALSTTTCTGWTTD